MSVSSVLRSKSESSSSSRSSGHDLLARNHAQYLVEDQPIDFIGMNLHRGTNSMYCAVFRLWPGLLSRNSACTQALGRFRADLDQEEHAVLGEYNLSRRTLSHIHMAPRHSSRTRLILCAKSEGTTSPESPATRM